METSRPLPCPMPVSGCIKFFRWTFLLLGVYYGFTRHSILAKNEVAIREEELRLKKIRDARIAKERQIQSDKDIAMLASLAGPPTAPAARPAAGSAAGSAAGARAGDGGDKKC